MRHFLAAAPRLDRVDHRAEMPAISDQGQVGTCVACAVGYYDKTFQAQRENHWGMNHDDHRFCPLFIYSQRSDAGTDVGMTIRQAMKIVNQEGVCSLKAMPYREDGIDQKPTLAQRKAARPHRSRSFARIASLGEAELYLRNNCFVAALMVHESFMGTPGAHPDAHGRRPLRRRPRALLRRLRATAAAADLHQLLGPGLGRFGLRLHHLRRFSGTSDGCLGDGATRRILHRPQAPEPARQYVLHRRL
jgi:hypothetical protein